MLGLNEKLDQLTAVCVSMVMTFREFQSKKLRFVMSCRIQAKEGCEKVNVWQ